MATSIPNVLAQMQRWTAAEASDAVLLQRYVHQRDEAAFAALVARHGALVLHVCRRILGDAHESEDAFQAVFLILARKAHSLRKPETLSAWLHGVARRVALKARTKTVARTVEMPLAEELPDLHADPLTRLTVRELLEILDEEVARLPSAQRSAVILCCLEGRTREEAARILGWTQASLKSHLQRGRQRLQERLVRRGIILPSALAIVVVSRGEAASALLLRSTVAAALSGGIGSSAAALAHGVLKTIFLTKLAGVMTVVLTVALAASTVMLVYRGPVAEAPEDMTLAAPALPRQEKPRQSKPRVDAVGDPLPPGAIARLGSQRFRHADDIARIAFTSDDKRLVSQGADGVRHWDAATGKELRHIAPEAGRFWAAGDLSPDGKWLAGKFTKPYPSLTGPLELWDTESSRKIADVGEGFCANACFSPDGKLLAFTSKQENVCIYDLKSRRTMRSWQSDLKDVWSIAFSADSRQLLTSDKAGLVRLWDVATGRQLQEFRPQAGATHAICPEYTALSPDGKLLALIEDNERQTPAAGKVEWKARISVRDAATGKQVRLLTCAAKEFVQGIAFPFVSLLFRRDSKRLLTSGPDEFLREWDVATGKELRRIALPPGMPPYALRALSRDEKQLAAVMVGVGLPSDRVPRAIRLIDLADGKMREEPAGHQAPVGLAILAPDGRTAITGYFPDSALIWDVAKGTVRRRFDNQGLPIFGLSLTADGRTLFSSSTDNNIRVWDMETGTPRRVINVSQGLVGEVVGSVVSRDGKIVALVGRQSSDRSIRVFDGESGQERQHFQAPSIYSLSLSADGRWLVGWGDERKVRVWDLAAGVKRQEYALPPDPPGGLRTRYSAAASPDGRLLAVCTAQGWTAKDANWLIVKDLATGLDVHRIRNPPSQRGVLTFSPDGRTLAYSGTSDATIRFLEVASGKERLRLAGLQGRAIALSFSASGNRLISGCTDTTALIWDLGIRPEPRAVNPEELERLWANLADTDASHAYQAIRKLAASPASSISFIRERLRPVAAMDEKQAARSIADLDSDEFAVRDKATVELKKLGELALPVFRNALKGKPPLEARRRLEDLMKQAETAWWDVSGERLRSLRAVEVLELADTKEARDMLANLAVGAAGARLTQDAKSALERLAKQARK
ncbi:MAG: sigma-70 family RNA polymerase sigma factor [Gemmataceae bacterium]